MKYIVVKDYDRDSIERIVNKFINDGYVPLGGISVTVVGWCDLQYTQAMIKEDNGNSDAS